jgi:hypothetical protein
MAGRCRCSGRCSSIPCQRQRGAGESTCCSGLTGCSPASDSLSGASAQPGRAPPGLAGSQPAPPERWLELQQARPGSSPACRGPWQDSGQPLRFNRQPLPRVSAHRCFRCAPAARQARDSARLGARSLSPPTPPVGSTQPPNPGLFSMLRSSLFR